MDLLASTGLPPSRRRFIGQVAAAAGAGFLSVSFRALSQGPKKLAPVDESLRGQLIFYSNSTSNPEHIGVFGYDLESRKWRVILDDVHPEGVCRASPDQKSFAVSEWISDQPRVSIIGPDGRTKVSGLRSRISWAPGGREVVLSEWRIKGRLRSKTWRMNMDGSGRVQLPIPDNELVLDWSPDGLWLLVCNRVYNETNKDTIIRRCADGTGPRPLIDAKIASKVDAGRFSPDGRRVAYTRIRVEPRTQYE